VKLDFGIRKPIKAPAAIRAIEFCVGRERASDTARAVTAITGDYNSPARADLSAV
jgi:hypothetical protein